MKPIGIDHFANFAFLNHLKVSDGGKAAFLIKRQIWMKTAMIRTCTSGETVSRSS